MSKHVVTLLPGDGIGPEVVGITVRAIEALPAGLGTGVGQECEKAGLPGEKPCLPLLKSPVRTGRLLNMWPQKAEYVR